MPRPDVELLPKATQAVQGITQFLAFSRDRFSQSFFDSIKKSMHFRVLMGRDEEELGRRKREVLRLVEGVASKLNFLPTPDFRFSIEDTLMGTPRIIRERLKTYAGLGCQQFILTFMDYPKFDSLEIFASTLI